MDQRLEKALEFSNYGKTLQIKKDNLFLRREHMLICNFENHIFIATMELINFVSLFTNDSSIIVEDSNKIPVKISNIKEFKDILIKTYQLANNEYYDKYESLKRARTVQKVAQ